MTRCSKPKNCSETQNNSSKTTPFTPLLLRERQVLELLSVSRSALFLGVKSGIYPQPVKLSPKIKVWRAADIQGFVDGLGQVVGE